MEVARMRLKKEILIICFLYLSNTLLADLRFDQKSQMWFSTNQTKNIDCCEYDHLVRASFEAANKGAKDLEIFTSLRLNGSPEAMLVIEDLYIYLKKRNDDQMRIQNPAAADLYEEWGRKANQTFFEELFGKEGSEIAKVFLDSLLGGAAGAFGVYLAGASPQEVKIQFVLGTIVCWIIETWRQSKNKKENTQ